MITDTNSQNTAFRAVLGYLAFGLRVWASVCLALFLAYWLQLDNPFWAGTSAGIVCQPTLGASLRKASFRLIGTILGAPAVVLISAAFPQDRWGFLLTWQVGVASAASAQPSYAISQAMARRWLATLR